MADKICQNCANYCREQKICKIKDKFTARKNTCTDYK